MKILIILYSILFLVLLVQRIIFNGRGSLRNNNFFYNSMIIFLSVSIVAIFLGGFIQIFFLIGLYLVGSFLADYLAYILYKYVIIKNQNGKVPKLMSYKLFRFRSNIIKGKKYNEVCNRIKKTAEMLTMSGVLNELFVLKNKNNDYLIDIISRLIALGHIYLAYALLCSPKLLYIFITEDEEEKDFLQICYKMYEYIGTD